MVNKKVITLQALATQKSHCSVAKSTNGVCTTHLTPNHNAIEWPSMELVGKRQTTPSLLVHLNVCIFESASSGFLLSESKRTEVKRTTTCCAGFGRLGHTGSHRTSHTENGVDDGADILSHAQISLAGSGAPVCWWRLQLVGMRTRCKGLRVPTYRARIGAGVRSRVDNYIGFGRSSGWLARSVYEIWYCHCNCASCSKKTRKHICKLLTSESFLESWGSDEDVVAYKRVHDFDL